MTADYWQWKRLRRECNKLAKAGTSIATDEWAYGLYAQVVRIYNGLTDVENRRAGRVVQRLRNKCPFAF